MRYRNKEGYKLFMTERHRLEKNAMSEEQKEEIVGRHGANIEFIPNPSEKLQMMAVREDGFYITLIKNPTERVKMEAARNYYNLRFIPNPTKKMRRFAESCLRKKFYGRMPKNATVEMCEEDNLERTIVKLMLAERKYKETCENAVESYFKNKMPIIDKINKKYEEMLLDPNCGDMRRILYLIATAPIIWGLLGPILFYPIRFLFRSPAVCVQGGRYLLTSIVADAFYGVGDKQVEIYLKSKKPYRETMDEAKSHILR